MFLKLNFTGHRPSQKFFCLALFYSFISFDFEITYYIPSPEPKKVIFLLLKNPHPCQESNLDLKRNSYLNKVNMMEMIVMAN